MTSKQIDLTKNFFALGLMFWLYERSMDPTIDWIDEKFSAPTGHRRGQQACPEGRLRLRRDDRDLPQRLPGPAGPACAPGTYRNITGNEAAALGFLAASQLAKRDLFYGSLSDHPGLRHPPPARQLQAFRGQDVPGRGRDRGDRRRHRCGLRRRAGDDRHVRARASRSRREAMGLAVMIELPLVVIDVQRAGPSTGMPTKTEQARPAPDHVRPQLGLADPDRGAGDTRRVLRRWRSRPGGSRSST